MRMSCPVLMLASCAIALSLLLSACASTGSNPQTGGAPATGSQAQAPRIVAATSWEATFARAAGATDVRMVAPANLPHAPDYDPKPSDLAAVANADYVLYAGFQAFAPRLKEAAGSEATLVEVKLENSPAVIRSEVTRLAELFGTEQAAAGWLARFDREYQRLSDAVKAKLSNPPPRVVANVFATPWVEFAGVQLIGTFGPAPVTPSQLAQLTGATPDLVFDIVHISPGQALPGTTITEVDLINYPGDGLDLLGVFEENARRIEQALAR
jgi:zinc transport system substrate-binding protein